MTPSYYNKLSLRFQPGTAYGYHVIVPGPISNRSVFFDERSNEHLCHRSIPKYFLKLSVSNDSKLLGLGNISVSEMASVIMTPCFFLSGFFSLTIADQYSIFDPYIICPFKIFPLARFEIYN